MSKAAGRGKRAGKERSLTAELSTLLGKTLVPDLTARAKLPGVREALQLQHQSEQDARRTADAFDAWVARLVEQVGAAWVLSCVFVRTLEDRGLVAQRRIAGKGAADAEQLFFELGPSLTARDYLLTVFRELGRLPGAEPLLGQRHNLAFRLSPSNEGARALLDFFRVADEAGQLRWRFEGSDTRFLGDLYQDLSEEVRKRFALLQTPRFVERFILDLTLEPAIAEFGLEEVRVIDPTCGSGHFLLGAFDRLFEHRMRTQPGKDAKEHAGAALGQVHGVDLNPYAVAIARFRLVLSYLEKAGITKLREAPPLPLHLVVADSLLHAVKDEELRFSRVHQDAAWGDQIFRLEEPAEAERILTQRYHAVVGNPPYITCKDSVLREEYRKRYESCHGKYALSAPFTERFFQLASDGGFVGMINANSFLKREFGKPLIEKVLPRHDLTRVIDTSGAYIPGHGTPTLLLFGRRRAPVGDTVAAVLGKRGEPTTPEDPEHGLVWASIAGQFANVGYDNEFVSVAGLARATLGKHPWSLGGGGAAELKELLEERCEKRLGDLTESVGFMAITGEDDAFVADPATFQRFNLPSRVSGFGEAVRDWALDNEAALLFPYDDAWLPTESHSVRRWLWPYRTLLAKRLMFGKTQVEAGLDWFVYRHFGRGKVVSRFSIAFAEVATHNHFVLDRGGKVFNRTAPIIKLPDGATEEDHLALLAFMNSSATAFWMKQVFMNKGGSGIGRGVQDEAWESRFQFDGTKLGSCPLPPPTYDATRIAEAIERIVEARNSLEPAQVIERQQSGAPLSLALDLAATAEARQIVHARMVALQEELDWLCYEAFGLLSGDDLALLHRARGEALPDFPRHIEDSDGSVCRFGLYAGHRAFEVVLARDCLQSGTHTAWFQRNGYRSPSEITSTYAPAYQRLIEARVAIIDRNPQIALIERPEHKRRWTLDDPQAEASAAARSFLLDALERALASQTGMRSVAQLAAEVLAAPKAREVAALLFGDDPAPAVAALCSEEAVPCVAPLRHTEVGMEKRAAWEQTWDLQRREDAGEKLEIQVPPRHDPKDFRDPAYWRLRGKLDVPKERFISYPGAEKDDDKSPLVGWAGWNHLQRMTALAALYQERKTGDGWEQERLVPLLAGLLELVPWVKQWHNDPSPDYDGERLGDYFEKFVDTEARAFGLTAADLRAWRPQKGASKANRRSPGDKPSPKRGRRNAAST